jgi:hypothetical protein
MDSGICFCIIHLLLSAIGDGCKEFGQQIEGNYRGMAIMPMLKSPIHIASRTKPWAASPTQWINDPKDR